MEKVKEAVLQEPLKRWQVRDLIAEHGNLIISATVKVSAALYRPLGINDVLLIKLSEYGAALEFVSSTLVGNEGPGVLLVKVAANTEHVEECVDQECQNCQRRFTEEELTIPVPDLEQRVSAGEPVPSGECPVPECRAVCHPVFELPAVPWKANRIQFARLLAEIQAMGLTNKQREHLREAMELTAGQLKDIFERAEDEWEMLKKYLAKAAGR